MYELHLRYLDARQAGEVAPPRAADVRLRARSHARRHERDRSVPGRELRRPVRLSVAREQRAPASPAGV